MTHSCIYCPTGCQSRTARQDPRPAPPRPVTSTLLPRVKGESAVEEGGGVKAEGTGVVKSRTASTSDVSCCSIVLWMPQDGCPSLQF